MPTSIYNVERTTSNLGIRYHVNPREFNGHPGIAADLAAEKGFRGKAIATFESNVERVYKQALLSQCQVAMARKERRRDEEIGFLGFGTDWEKVKAIEEEKVESCEELRRLH